MGNGRNAFPTYPSGGMWLDDLLRLSFAGIRYDFNTGIFQDFADRMVNGSLGGFAGNEAISLLPVSQSTAINGTLYPIHETKGITPSVFEGTLQELNAQTLLKFQRRMCGSAADYKAFQTIAPKRPVEELKEELAAIRQQYLSSLLRSLSGKQPSSEITIGFSFRTIKSRHGETRQSPPARRSCPLSAGAFNEVIMNIK